MTKFPKCGHLKTTANIIRAKKNLPSGNVCYYDRCRTCQNNQTKKHHKRMKTITGKTQWQLRKIKSRRRH